MPFTLLAATKPGALLAIAHFIDATLRGASQVVIINNPLAGVLIIASLFFPSAIVGAHGVVGLVGATLTAFLLRLDPQAVSSGLFGYNGLLVGMALSTFLSRDDPTASISVAVASALLGGLSTIINLALGNALVPKFGTPPFTLAFNLTMLLTLLASEHLDVFSRPSATSAPTPPTDVAVDIAWLLEAALVAVGQIFLCESATSGALILAGMCVSSRLAALAAYIGALGGTALALALGADRASIAHGLWGYNSSLTAVAALTFFVPSLKGCVMASIGVALTTLLDAALRAAAAPTGTPIGTLPFCLAALTVQLTHGSIPGFEAVPLGDVSTPEDHIYSARVGKVTEISMRAAPGDEGQDATQSDLQTNTVAAIAEETAEAANDEALESVLVDMPREALVLSPAMHRAAPTPLSHSPTHRSPCPHTPSRSRASSVHGGSHGAAATKWSVHNDSTASGLSPALARRAMSGTLHGGSHHGETYVARRLAAMSNGSGHGVRVTELAIRAADAIGITPPMLSPADTMHGGKHFKSLLQTEAQGKSVENPAAPDLNEGLPQGAVANLTAAQAPSSEPEALDDDMTI